MNDDQARINRLYQYLLSKDVFLKQGIVDRQKLANRKKPHPDDIFNLWYAMIKLEIWEEISREIWILIK